MIFFFSHFERSFDQIGLSVHAFVDFIFLSNRLPSRLRLSFTADTIVELVSAEKPPSAGGAGEVFWLLRTMTEMTVDLEIC